MSGAPEMARDQKADPQHGEPREILVKHPAPWKRSVEWGARIPVLFWNVEWRGNRRVGTGERAEFSLEESPGIIPRQLWEYHLRCFMRGDKSNCTRLNSLPGSSPPGPSGRSFHRFIARLAIRYAWLMA